MACEALVLPYGQAWRLPSGNENENYLPLTTPPPPKKRNKPLGLLPKESPVHTDTSNCLVMDLALELAFPHKCLWIMEMYSKLRNGQIEDRDWALPLFQLDLCKS